MSESVATIESHSTHEHAVPDEPFDKSDLSMFKSDDKEAGTNICKMLVAFFFYSLVAMAFVTGWAFNAMKENHVENQNQPHAEEHATHHE